MIARSTNANLFCLAWEISAIATSARHNTTRPLVIDGREISFEIVRSPRAKLVRLRIGPEPIVRVVVPNGHKLDSIDQLLTAEKRWIFKQLDSLDRRMLFAWQPVAGVIVPYLGSDYRLEPVIRIGRPEVLRRLDSLVIYTPGEDASMITAVLKRWFRNQANEVMSKRVEHWSTRMHLEFERIRIKDQRSRWGSCSSKGNLNFNWRLVMAPMAVIDYVVIHELAHLSVPNHSDEFWALVERHCSDRKNHQAWLRENGVRLSTALPAM